MKTEKEIINSVQMIYTGDKEPYKIDSALLSGGDASEIIGKALDEYKSVDIPYLTEPLYLTKPIVMRSGIHLTIHKDTVIRMKPGCGGCMLRNEHVMNCMEAPYSGTDTDTGILVEGGIWDRSIRTISPYDLHPAMNIFREKNIILGVIFFSNVRNFVIRNMTIRDGDQYAVLIAGCDHYIIEDLYFDRYKKDGVHINGPSSYGLVRRLHGTTGDDFVALNAWDWCSSSVSFGSIHNIIIQDIHGEHDEIRLLPGRKTYNDGIRTECEIYNCLFRRISGIYNIKMYQQPNCHNHELGMNDRSEIVGVMRNICFSDLELAHTETEGMAEVHLNAMFEICADCENLIFENINIAETEETYLGSDMHLTDVGPKSSTWTRDKKDPDTWCELFDPDLICTAKNLYFKNIRFAGKECGNINTLAHAHQLSLNPDYPLTLPKGGTGYGIIENAVFLAHQETDIESYFK